MAQLSSDTTSRPALKTLNAQHARTKSPKLPRVKFSTEQRQYLAKCFHENSRPTHQEKMAISKKLGVDLRTIVIFFCNKRARLNQKLAY